MATADTQAPYSLENANGYSILALHPELNDIKWAEIERIGNDLVNKLNADAAPAWLVDLTSLNYMGSAMVALIVRLWKAIKPRNGKMVVVNHNELVNEVLETAGLASVWTIVDTREQGIRRLGFSSKKSAFAAPVAGGGGGAPMLTYIGPIALIIAVGVLAQGALPPALKDPGLLLLLCGALGAVAGFITWKREGGSRKNMAGAVAVAGVLIVCGAGWKMWTDSSAPTSTTPAPASSSTPAAPPQ